MPILIAAFMATGCAAQVDEREMNFLGSALTKLSASVHATVRFGAIPEGSSSEAVLQTSTDHDPELLRPFAGKLVKVQVVNKNSAVLVCDAATGKALLEDSGCTAQMDSHRWTSGVNTQCEFTLNLQAICGR
ncbi:hypothetical protein [uncultured Hydrogenophaga sp.]|uniref:hypothetical protein n=1 Tax=uncultured Hydrogenophaga sp. TaxID=199683 RepID=UPI003748D564